MGLVHRQPAGQRSECPKGRTGSVKVVLRIKTQREYTIKNGGREHEKGKIFPEALA